jgi:hypothetical protein
LRWVASGDVRLLGDEEEVDRHTPQLHRTVVDRADQIRADAEAFRLLSVRVPWWCS